MKAIQCCYFLALVSSHLMAGVMSDDNIFLSNSDLAALYCVAKIFPDGENILQQRNGHSDGHHAVGRYGGDQCHQSDGGS